MKRILLFILMAIFITSACTLTNILRPETENIQQTVEAKVAETVIAMETERAEPVTEATPTAGKQTPVEQAAISGELSYPSEVLPPQRVVAFDVNDPAINFLIEVHSGNTYSIEVPPGTYYVLSFPMDAAGLGAEPGISGAYSEAVPCGLNIDCDDHSLMPVNVDPGQRVTGIDPADWYATAQQSSEWPTDPTLSDTGTILGDLGFPSEYIPPLRVVAFNIYTDDYFYVDTQLNQSEYQMKIPPGTYHVMAYVREDGPDFPGGYTYFVTCGMTVDCNDHQLIDVWVYAGQSVSDVSPIDFYAFPDEVDWPANPTE